MIQLHFSKHKTLIKIRISLKNRFSRGTKSVELSHSRTMHGNQRRTLLNLPNAVTHPTRNYIRRKINKNHEGEAHVTRTKKIIYENTRRGFSRASPKRSVSEKGCVVGDRGVEGWSSHEPRRKIHRRGWKALRFLISLRRDFDSRPDKKG